MSLFPHKKPTISVSHFCSSYLDKDITFHMGLDGAVRGRICNTDQSISFLHLFIIEESLVTLVNCTSLKDAHDHLGQLSKNIANTLQPICSSHLITNDYTAATAQVIILPVYRSRTTSTSSPNGFEGKKILCFHTTWSQWWSYCQYHSFA